MKIICPHCDVSIPKHHSTYETENVGFKYSRNSELYEGIKPDFLMTKIECPNCHGRIYKISGLQEPYNIVQDLPIYPLSRAIKFPEYIPNFLREDYEEAFAIVNLSPKASATLSRRCLQGLIRDFYGVTKGTLYDEIQALEGKVPALQLKVLHSFRDLGNIGAHMQKDVNLIIDISSEEAEQLLKLIEYLFKVTYIEKHEAELLFESIIETKSSKENLKKSKS